MRAYVETGVGDFADRVGPFLLGDPVVNNVVYTLLVQRRDGLVATEPDCLLVRVEDGQGTVGVAIRTPPRGLLLSAMSDGAAAVIADHLAAVGYEVPAVGGPVAASGAFAERYAAATGVSASEGLGTRLYRLDGVTGAQGVQGHLRAGSGADRDVLVAWTNGFHREAVPTESNTDSTPMVDTLLGAGQLFVWVAGGVPVSMAAVGEPAAGVVRVRMVYTPGELRGRGYGSAVVASVSRLSLDRGAAAMMLAADVGNPVANRIYRRIRYRPVSEGRVWLFTR